MRRLGMQRIGATGLIVALALCVGCVSSNPRGVGHAPSPTIAVPPAGSVPTELNPITLPEHVIEPPDVIQIVATIRNVKPDEELERINKELRDPDKKLTADEKKKLEEQKEKRMKAEPVYSGDVRDLDYQEVRNSFQVQPDGFVHLGAYGSIPVSGLTVNQARQAIRTAIAKQVNLDTGGTLEDRILVVVSVLQYNSKYYYVLSDGGGAGERMARFPITGKEFVTDAISNIGGLPEEASKRNIWVARRTPQLNEDQILPVDWVGMSQWGITSTNYQLLPGDRVYIKAQRLVTVDRTLARILQPVERLFGVTLLGASTTNQVIGRGNGFGGNNR